MAGSLRPIVARNFCSLGMMLKTMKAVTPMAETNTSEGYARAVSTAARSRRARSRRSAARSRTGSRCPVCSPTRTSCTTICEKRGWWLMASARLCAFLDSPGHVAPDAAHRRPRSKFGDGVERIQERHSAAEHDGHLPQAEFDMDARRRQPVPRPDGGQEGRAPCTHGRRRGRHVVADIEQQPAATADFMHRRRVGGSGQGPLLGPAGGVAGFERETRHGKEFGTLELSKA